MKNNKASGLVGNVGFYKQDPGGKKSPNLILSENEGKLTVFEVPTQLVFKIDADEWMDLKEMRSSTLAILNGPHDDTTIAILNGRIEALADAQQFNLERFEMHQHENGKTIAKLADRVWSLLDTCKSEVNYGDSLAKTLRTAKQALQNVPMVGSVFDQQHSDLHMAATLEIEITEGQAAAPASTFKDRVALPTVVIEMDCGAIHRVRSSMPMHIVILDADIEGADKENLAVINGDTVYLHNYKLNDSAGEDRNGIDYAFVSNVLPQIQEKVEFILPALAGEFGSRGVL